MSIYVVSRCHVVRQPSWPFSACHDVSLMLLKYVWLWWKMTNLNKIDKRVMIHQYRRVSSSFFHYQTSLEHRNKNKCFFEIWFFSNFHHIHFSPLLVIFVFFSIFYFVLFYDNHDECRLAETWLRIKKIYFFDYS